MTISYSLETATSGSYHFYRCMLRWKGSVWQGIWQGLLAWCVAYGILSIIYRNFLDEPQKQFFEKLSLFCAQYAEYIPLTFMLGFYVSFVINRWWDQYMNLGWIDSPCMLLPTYVRGSDDGAQLVRRSCARWLVVAQVLVLRDISPAIRKRFPTIQHMIDANLLTESEQELLDSVKLNHHKYFIPTQWCCTLLSKARDEGRIESDLLLQHLITAITTYRSSLGVLFSYDWISIPLAYSQVVNLGVKTYFIAGILGRQYLRHGVDPTNTLDLYVPIFTIMQFIIFVGWLKVAEVLMNPLGEDDEDFELNYIITRNIQVGLCMVDESYGSLPKLEKDAFWDSDVVELPHTEASKAKADYGFVGSCADMRVSKKDQAFVTPPFDLRSSLRHQTTVIAGGRRCRSTRIRRDDLIGRLELPYISGARSVVSSPVMGIKRRFSHFNDILWKQIEQKRRNLDSDLQRKRKQSAISNARFKPRDKEKKMNNFQHSFFLAV